MKCPACSLGMKEVDFGGVMVDVCQDGCKGIWFDWVELEKLDETHEGSGEILKQALDSDYENQGERGALACPKCQKPMQDHLYKSAKQVTVDECYLCGGFFLDSGELKILRDQYITDEERDFFVKALMVECPQYGTAQAELKKDKLRLQAIKKMTKFLRPSRFFKEDKS